jgi:hypothetical protein
MLIMDRKTAGARNECCATEDKPCRVTHIGSLQWEAAAGTTTGRVGSCEPLYVGSFVPDRIARMSKTWGLSWCTASIS